MARTGKLIIKVTEMDQFKQLAKEKAELEEALLRVTRQRDVAVSIADQSLAKPKDAVNALAALKREIAKA